MELYDLAQSLNQSRPQVYSTAATSSVFTEAPSVGANKQLAAPNMVARGYSGNPNNSSNGGNRLGYVADGRDGVVGYNWLWPSSHADLTHRLDALERVNDQRWGTIEAKLDLFQRTFVSVLADPVWEDPPPPIAVSAPSVAALCADELAELLDYIADTGAPAGVVSVGDVEAGLRSDDPLVRAASARALRVMAPDRVADTLGALTINERSGFVRAVYQGVLRAVTKG